MEQKKAAELVSKNLRNIFAFSIARLYDKSEAEDLTNDIVYEILKSVHRLKNEELFFGFMWKIAENTFRTYIRKSKVKMLQLNSVFICDNNKENMVSNALTYGTNPEEECIKNEEFNLIRRELSLLSKQYRETTVAYYIYGKSCFEIAHELNISMEMVKYYLFKTRKILKEGIGMIREFGERSYNPETFKMDYWGTGDNFCYWAIFQRKLPGNIVLAAYYVPMTLQELSIELGVAAVYMEEEIELLMEHEIIKKTGNKYQTNIIIFTEEYEKELIKKIKPIYEEAAEKLNIELKKVMPKLKELDFKGNDYNENRLNWTFTNLTLYFAYHLINQKGKEQFGEYPSLTNGGNGFIFGYGNNYTQHHFNGIYQFESTKKGVYFSVTNYCVIEACQNWKPANWNDAIEAMTDAIYEQSADQNNEMLIELIRDEFISSNNGTLTAMFPVFSEDILKNTIWEFLKPLSEEMCSAMINICSIAAQVLSNHVPKSLLNRCKQLAYIHHQTESMAHIVETMVEKKYLKIPKDNEKLCIFGIKK